MPKAKKPLPRVQKTLFCPRCGKRFGNETRVLQHMNQPSSACSAFLNDISHPSLPLSSQVIQLPRPPSHTRETHQVTSPEVASGTQIGFDDLPYDDWPMDVPNDMPDDAQESDLQHTPGSNTPSPGNIKYFPGASQSYPGRKTFMDQFFSDKHGELHKDNLFYPFASQEDWQMASWLLRSRLSMAAIDSFLSLDLVSYILL